MRVLATALLIGAGCGTTHIMSTDPTARIYVDGELLGIGRAETRQRGTPHTAVVMAKTPDGRSTKLDVKRRFTGVTLLAGLFSYGIGLFAFWEYPEAVYLPIDAPQTDAQWAEGADPWLAVQPGWGMTPDPPR